MLSDEEQKAIEDLKDFKSISILYGNTFIMFLGQLKKYQEATDTALNLLTKLQKEIEHQKEKREHQKVELAILNERQKEMNKLKNTVNSYYGMFKKQEKVIREIQKENEEKDNKVRKIIKRLDNDYKRITETKINKGTFPNYLDDYTRCRLKAYKTKTKEIKEYIEKQYFEKSIKGENVNE